MGKSTVAGRGRKKLYNATHVRAFKAVCRKHGLVGGRDILMTEGVEINGEVKKFKISLPTLASYVKSEVAGKPLTFSRGRPAAA